MPFGDVARTIAGADWLTLTVVSLPAYLLIVWLRALRWGHLTDPIQPIGRATLTRAMAVGFMANNLFPLRVGEVVRSWYLSREAGTPIAAIFGTVILERIIDIAAVVALAFGVVSLMGARDEGVLGRAALLMLPFGLAPLLVLGALRLAPGRTLAAVRTLLRPFPERFAHFASEQLERFAEGLGALRGGVHLFWIAVQSVLIWVLVGPLPFLAGLWALDIEFASTSELLLAAVTTQAAIGVAVALPSAPGFFGTYHWACRKALEPFGVPPEKAVALGTLCHVYFWVILTLLGFLVLRLRQTSLGEIDGMAGGEAGDPPT